jgi:hypothetical protein
MAKVATASAWSSKIEGRRMRVLKVNEYTLLELTAFKPLSYLPCNDRLVAERLVKRGLLLREDGQWYPTAMGLGVLGRTLH